MSFLARVVAGGGGMMMMIRVGAPAGVRGVLIYACAVRGIRFGWEGGGSGAAMLRGVINNGRCRERLEGTLVASYASKKDSKRDASKKNSERNATSEWRFRL